MSFMGVGILGLMCTAPLMAPNTTCLLEGSQYMCQKISDGGGVKMAVWEDVELASPRS